MSDDYSSERKSAALASLTRAGDDLQAFLDAPHETTQKQRLPDAVATINWVVFAAGNPRYGRMFNFCCSKLQTEPQAVSRLFLSSFIKYWTAAAHQLVVEAIGVQKMRTVYTFSDSF